MNCIITVDGYAATVTAVEQCRLHVCGSGLWLGLMSSMKTPVACQLASGRHESRGDLSFSL